MNKLFKKIGMVTLGLSMVLGVGVGVASLQGGRVQETKAATEVVDTLTISKFTGCPSSYSTIGTEYEYASTTDGNNSGVTYSATAINSSNGIRGNKTGLSNFNLRNKLTYDNYYISSISLTVSGGTLDGSTSGRSVTYVNSIVYSMSATVPASGTLLTTSPSSSGQTTLTWSNTSEGASYFMLYSLKTSGTCTCTSLTITWTQKSADPSISLSKSSLVTYVGSLDVESISVSNVANMAEPYTYAWTLESGTSVTLPETKTNSSIAVTPVATGASVVRCTVTDSTAGTPLTAYAECTITVQSVLSVTEAIAAADGASYYVKGYVATADYGATYNSKFDIVDASATANTNNTTSIMLYNGSKIATIAQGDYVVVYGPLTTYGTTTRELNGFSVISASTSASLLNDFVMGSETENQCTFKYAVAKAHYLAMSAGEQTSFTTSATYAAAKARYEAWAVNQGDTSPYVASQAVNVSGNLSSDSMIIILVVVSLLSVTAIGAFFFYKKRKENA